MYDPYRYLFAKETDHKVEKFVSRDRSLREYTMEIEKVKTMASEVASLPVFVPMHFFLLDCTQLNQVNIPTLLLFFVCFLFYIYIFFHTRVNLLVMLSRQGSYFLDSCHICSPKDETNWNILCSFSRHPHSFC